VHVSVSPTKARYDDAKVWAWGAAKPNADAGIVEDLPLIAQGEINHGIHVAKAKMALIKALQAEPGFGPLLDGLVRGFQKQNKLKVDGKIGSYTWPLLRL
jgi:murein L,D-transpeptidase YcbB/YkuD